MAEFITSRTDYSKLQSANALPNEWWNIWTKRLRVYHELLIGDTLYWYDATKRAIVSQSTVIDVDRFRFSSKTELFARLDNFFGNVDQADSYTASKPDEGYCLAFKVRHEANLHIPRPEHQSFPRAGWLRLTEEVRGVWLGRSSVEFPSEEETTLDSYGTELQEINKRMQEVTPERRNQLVSVSIRKDAKIVQALKAAADYRCQFPACDAQIKKKDGTPYVEVAHIRPVAQRGKSILGNLLVLCPNHHKEFDLGQLEIARQTPSELVGHLNGRSFTIRILK